MKSIFDESPCSFNSRTNLCQSARKSGRPNTRLILARGFIRTCTTARSDALFFSKRVSKTAISLAKENQTDKRKKKRIGLRHTPVTGEQSETRSNIRRTKSYCGIFKALCVPRSSRKFPMNRYTMLERRKNSNAIETGRKCWAFESSICCIRSSV